MAEYRYYLIPDAMTRAFPEQFEKQTPTEFFDNIADLEKRYHQLREMPYNNERTWNERARFPYARLVVGVDRQNPDGAVAIIQVRNGVNYLCDDYRGPYANGSDAQIPQMAKKLVEVIGVDRVRPHTYTQRDGYTWVQVEKDMHITEWLYAHLPHFFQPFCMLQGCFSAIREIHCNLITTKESRNYMSENTERRYLKWYNKVGYGSGDVAGNVVYAFLSSFVMIYLTDTVGLNPGIVGTLIAVSKLFDGITDIFFGSMIDKTHSKMGKARPWMLYGYIGCAITLVGIFAIPMGMSEFAKYAWFFICYSLLNAVFYTANNIAYALATVARALVAVAGYTGSGDVKMMLLFTAIAALGQGPWQGDMNAVIASCSEYTWLTKHKRVDGTMYSCTSLGVKLGGGLGTAITGWLLAFSNYDKALAVQPESCIHMLKLMYLVIPFVLDAIITFILSRMKVEEANDKIRAEMKN